MNDILKYFLQPESSHFFYSENKIGNQTSAVAPESTVDPGTAAAGLSGDHGSVYDNRLSPYLFSLLIILGTFSRITSSQSLI